MHEDTGDEANNIRRKCKPEADIEHWLENKFIITLENEKKFVQDDFGENRIQKNSTLKWYPISTI